MQKVDVAIVRGIESKVAPLEPKGKASRMKGTSRQDWGVQTLTGEVDRTVGPGAGDTRKNKGSRQNSGSGGSRKSKK